MLGMCVGAAEDSADQADPDGGDTAALREVPRRTGHARANHSQTVLDSFLETFSAVERACKWEGLG